MTDQRGFTLLELSIVLVIIGLIIGGVVVGSSLIEQTKVQKSARQLTDIEAMLHVFKLKYGKLPGDLPNASTYWGTSCDATPANCNGNGNDIIADTTNFVEGNLMWRHLSLAQIAPGDYQLLGSGSKMEPGTHLLAGAFEGSGFILRQGRAYGTDYHQVIEYGMPNTGSGKLFVNDGMLPVTVVEALDSKFDDGNALIGKIRGVGGPGGTSNTCTGKAYNDTTGTGVYQLSSSTATCSLNRFLN